MSKPQSPTFTGRLAEQTMAPTAPVLVSPLTAKSSDFMAENRANLEKWRGQRVLTLLQAHLERLPLLFEHYAIEPPPMATLDPRDPWHRLVLRLAADFVPGFQLKDPPKKRGRKTKWDTATQVSLVLEVEQEVLFRSRSRRCSENRAMAELLKRDPWKRMCTSVEILRTRLKEARTAWPFQIAERLPPDAAREFLASIAGWQD